MLERMSRAEILCGTASKKNFWNKVSTLLSEVIACMIKPNNALSLLRIGVDDFLDEFRSAVVCILFDDPLKEERFLGF